MVSRSCGARNSRGGWISGTCRIIRRRWWYCHFCDVFLEGPPYIFCFMSQQPSWILFTAHCFGGKPSNGLASCSFFSASQALAKPWEAMAFAPLGQPSEWAKSSRDTKMAIRRWEPQARFQKPSGFGLFVFFERLFLCTYNNSKGVCVHIKSIRYNPLYTCRMSVTVLYITLSYD